MSLDLNLQHSDAPCVASDARELAPNSALRKGLLLSQRDLHIPSPAQGLWKIQRLDGDTGTVQAALAGTPMREKVCLRRFRMALDYDLYSLCKKILEERGAAIEGEEFAAKIEVRGSVPEDLFAELRDVLQEATSGRVVAETASS